MHVQTLHSLLSGPISAVSQAAMEVGKPARPRSGFARHGAEFQEKEKGADARLTNITAAKAVADAVRTSLGPRGMDKMIVPPDGEVVITNDGATILTQMKVQHPAAKFLVELSKAQDVEAGDGTTTVVVIAGSLLERAHRLILRGIHQSTISESFQLAASKAEEFLQAVAVPVDLDDRETLVQNASTSLNSKVVSQHAGLLAPIAVDAVLRTIDPALPNNVDLSNIRVFGKLGGVTDDTELVNGIVFTQHAVHAGGPTMIENAKVGLIQFQLSPPKTDMESNIVITDYSQMDRILREERAYILDLCRKIKKSGCNVLLIQKSILRDAVCDLAYQFLAKMKIMVVTDIERSEIEFICKTLGCLPVASVDALSPDRLGRAGLVEEVATSEGKVVKVTGVQHARTVTVFVRGSNKMMIEEAKRSLHDALCVVRSLVKKRFVIAGGGAPEIEAALQLQKLSLVLPGEQAYCLRSFADALEIIPYTLAENAGMNAIQIVTELKKLHANGEAFAGINVRKGNVCNMFEERVVQPLLVSTSAISLAAETVRVILKIDDILVTR